MLTKLNKYKKEEIYCRLFRIQTSKELLLHLAAFLCESKVNCEKNEEPRTNHSRTFLVSDRADIQPYGVAIR